MVEETLPACAKRKRFFLACRHFYSTKRRALSAQAPVFTSRPVDDAKRIALRNLVKPVLPVVVRRDEKAGLNYYQLLQHTDALIVKWRQALDDYAQYFGDASLSKPVLTFSANCVPTWLMVFGKRRRYRCGRFLFCPFCWARRYTMTAFRKLSRFVGQFSLEMNTFDLLVRKNRKDLVTATFDLPFDLVEFQRTQSFRFRPHCRPDGFGVADILKGYASLQSTKTFSKRYFPQALGHLKMVTVDATASGTPVLHERVVLLLPAGTAPVEMPQPMRVSRYGAVNSVRLSELVDDSYRIRDYHAHCQLTRQSLAGIVGRLTTFPAGLFLPGSRDVLRQWLECHHPGSLFDESWKYTTRKNRPRLYSVGGPLGRVPTGRASKLPQEWRDYLRLDDDDDL